MSLELSDLLSLKSNIFDHVLYEFEMYLQTYGVVYGMLVGTSHGQFEKNVFLESHAVHLRNLIEFFNRERDCITTDTVFVGEHDLSFDDSALKAKQTVSKTIDHLTKERYTWNQTEKDLTIRYSDVIHEMFRSYIVFRIRDCVELLIQETDVRPELLDKLHDDRIQSRLKELSAVCDEITGARP